MDVGTLGKIRTASKLIELGYDVFMELDGKSPFDLVAHKSGKLLKVEVKSTEKVNHNNSWEVQIRSVRSNKTTNKIVPFNNKSTDILSIYIHELDCVLLLKAKDVKAKHSLTVHRKDFK